jgi:hypothetical protein
MLEDPSYDHIVRWGEGGESFVVLEVRSYATSSLDPPLTLNTRLERKIHQDHSPKALQTQQLRELRAAIK